MKLPGFLKLLSIWNSMGGHAAQHAGMGVSQTLAHTSTPVQIYGGAGATEKVAGSITLAAGVVKPDSVLRIGGLCNFLLPNNAGRQIKIYINNVSVGQAFPTASMGSLHWIHEVYVLPDLSGATSYSNSLNDVQSPSAAQQGFPYAVRTSTKTNFTIDFTGAVTIEVRLLPQNTDISELTAWTVENLFMSGVPPFTLAPTSAVACWGDSLTAGTGASAAQLTSYPGQLLSVKRPGLPVANMGIGGQTTAQILARILADKVRGRLWTCIFQMGRNDVGVASNLTATVTQGTAAAVANLTHTRYLVGSVLSGAAETVGTANRTAITTCNAALAAAYGSRYVDLMAVLATSGGEIPISYRAVTASTTSTYSSGVSSLTVASATGIVNGMFVSGTGIQDQTTVTISGTTVTLSKPTTGAGSAATLSFVAASEVHLNDTSYALVANAYSTALTAQGW